MVGDEGEMSVEAEVSFSTLRWSSRIGNPSAPIYGDPLASLAIPGCSRSHFFPACTLMHTDPFRPCRRGTLTLPAHPSYSTWEIAQSSKEGSVCLPDRV